MAGFKGISVVNDGGYVAEFEVQWAGPSPKFSTGYGGHFPLGSTGSIDLSTGQWGIQPGQTMRPRLHAILGKHEDGDWVTYDPAGSMAVYKATGTTLSPHLKLES